MNTDISFIESPLSTCVRTSGKLPISLQGHYGDWLKYHGSRGTFYEEGIKNHLKKRRIQRSLKETQRKNYNDIRLPSLRSERSKNRMSSNPRTDVDIFDMFNDIIDSGSTWWKGSPLPDIPKEELENTTQEIMVQQPFTISSFCEVRFKPFSSPVRSINEDYIFGLFPSKRLNIYVASSNIDMSEERRSLERTVWPQLKHLCHEYGRELIIHDLHTFSSEILLLGQRKYLQEINESLKICLEQRSGHIKALILFGDYFDEKSPPDTITENNMTILKTKMKKDNEEIKRIQGKIQQLKMQQQQIKQNIARNDSNLEAFNEKENSTLDQSNVLSFKSNNERINLEINQFGKNIDLLIYKTNLSLIEQWYCKKSKDSECYVLIPARNIIKELKSTENEKLEQGKALLKNVKDQLCYIISNYVTMDQNTVFEHQLDSLDELMKNDKCLLITRTFNNISNDANIKSLKSAIINKVKENCQRRFELKSDDNGSISVEKNWEHLSYLKHLSSNVLKILHQSLKETLEKEEKDFKENIHHLCISSLPERDTFYLFSELEFQNRVLLSKFIPTDIILPEIENAISQIEETLCKISNAIVVLASVPLSGKSSVISTFIKRFKKDNQSPNNSIFLYRFLGSSFQSVTMLNLIRSICLEIVYRLGIHISVPFELMALKTLFYELTLMIDFPVYLCMDGLDLLTDLNENGLSNFDWFPIRNNHFSLIVSCTEDSSVYKTLCSFFNSQNKEYNIVNISELENETIKKLVKSYLNLEMMLLTFEQEEEIQRQCSINKTIGFVESILRIVQYWTPTSSLPRLGNKLDLNIFFFFGKLEEIFNDVIIRRLLGYITCFKNGCTITELMDLMTLDDIVHKYLSTTFDNEHLRYTFSLLRYAFTSLDKILDEFLDESGFITIKWKNASYSKAANERYLLQKDKAGSYHQMVSNYFMNNEKDQIILVDTVEDETKVPKYSNMLIKQELLYNNEFSNVGNRFNLRKLAQMPYHLLQVQNNKLAKMICFYNFYWLQAFIINFGCNKLKEELTLASLVESEDLEFPLLLSTLALSNEVLVNDPSQLNSQLLGRLNDIIDNDLASRETQKYPYLEILRKSLWNNSWFMSIIPSKSCMKTSEINEITTMGFHFGKVTSILLHDEGTKLFVSTDNGVLYLWDTSKNHILYIILGIGKNVFQMLCGNLNKTLLTATTDFVEIWDLESRTIVQRIDMLYDMYCMTISEDRTIVSVFFYGIFWIASWNLESLETIVSKTLSLSASCNCDGEIVTSKNCKEFQALTSVKYDNKAILIDIRNGNINPNILRCKEEGSAITNLGISLRYFVVCNKGLSQKDYVSIIFYIDLFEHGNFQLVRRLTGCVLDCVISLSINTVGSHAITINSDRKMNISDIATWNLETEEHKHCSEIPIVFQDAQCTDFTKIFLLNSESSTIQKANILQSKNKRIEKRQNLSIFKYSINDLYVLIQSQDNEIIEIHNVIKKGKNGQKVKDLSGISSPNDITVPYKDKIIILSQRDYSPIVPECRDVFQLIKIYDLTMSRVTQKTTNVFIYPSRKSEFLVLNNDILMGLSENRSHLVFWNLITGHIQKRIKLNPLMFSMGGQYVQDNKELCSSKDARKDTLNVIEIPFPSSGRSIPEFTIDTILVSGDKSILVAAYFTRFLSVFSLTEECHKANLIGESALLHLQTAAITHNGTFLVQNNYNEKHLCTFLTLWNTETGMEENSIPVKQNILAVSITSDSKYIGFIKEKIGGFIWNTIKKDRSSFCHLPGSKNIYLGRDSMTYKIDFIRNDEILLIFSGRGFHFWNVFCDHLDILGSFQLDHSVQSFTPCCNDMFIAFLLHGSHQLYTIKIVNDQDELGKKEMTRIKYFENDEVNNSENNDN